MTQPARPLERPTPVTTLRAQTPLAAKMLRPRSLGGASLSAASLSPSAAAPKNSVAELLLETPARWLAELPAAPRLTLGTPDGLLIVGLDGSAADLDAGAWLALVQGVEADRVWAHDLPRLLTPPEGAQAVTARSMNERALDGALPDERECWTLRRVLARVGATLIDVELPRAQAA